MSPPLWLDWNKTSQDGERKTQKWISTFPPRSFSVVVLAHTFSESCLHVSSSGLPLFFFPLFYPTSILTALPLELSSANHSPRLICCGYISVFNLGLCCYLDQDFREPLSLARGQLITKTISKHYKLYYIRHYWFEEKTFENNTVAKIHVYKYINRSSHG